MSENRYVTEESLIRFQGFLQQASYFAAESCIRADR